MKRIVPVMVLVGVVALAVVGMWQSPVFNEGGRQMTPGDNPPVAALMYFWFGFDLETGESVGGLKSSHWNTDIGNYGSRVGITDEPEYGFYASDDRTVIARQLADMEDAGISVIIASWHGNGDTDFDSLVDDHEKKANHRALIALLDYIYSTQAPFKVSVLVEPYMVNPLDVTLEQKQTILDVLWDEMYGAYPGLMFSWEEKPLLIPWAAVDLKEPDDSRFTVKNWGSTSDRDWKVNTHQDWNWYPDTTLLSNMISDDGVFVVFPRFDEYWMHIMGKELPYPYRRIDPALTQGVYEQTWQVAVDNRDDINLVIIYCWNEHEEHAAIEPDKGISPVSYGRSLVEKTSAYYRQFLARRPIATYPGLWSQPDDLKQFIGGLNALELSLSNQVSVEQFLGDRLYEAQSLIEGRINRTYTLAEVPGGVKSIQLRLAANIYNYILMNKRNPVMEVHFEENSRGSGVARHCCVGTGRWVAVYRPGQGW